MSRIAPQKAFDILGVSPDDDYATIRRAWIDLFKSNHPDVVGGDIEELTAKLTAFNEAYDSLRWHSPEKVKIRKERAAEADRQTTGRQRDRAGRRPAAPWPGATAWPAETPRCKGVERQAGAARQGGTMRCRSLPGPDAAHQTRAWGTLSAAERFATVQSLLTGQGSACPAAGITA